MIINEKLNLKGEITCYLETIEGLEKGKIEIFKYNNLIVTVGKVAIGRRIAGMAEVANEGQATYGAVGTDATAPSASDVKLGTELIRKTFSDTSYASNVCTLRTYFDKTEANATLREVGIFGEDAGAGADSGTLFNHAAINITKDNTKTLTIDVKITTS